MKISIITCTYNSQDHVEDSIKSFLAQDYADKELVVIDGASKDKTLDILESYKEHIAVIKSEEDTGIYNAMNKGLDLISGEVFGFLHSDDVYASESVLSKVANEFIEGQTQVVYGDLIYTDASLSKTIRKWTSGSFKRSLFNNGWMPPHPTLFLKTDLLQQGGKFNEAFRISGDYEFILRYLYKMKLMVKYIPETLVKMRVGGESNQSLKNRLKANAEDRKAWRINGMNPFPATVFKPLRKILQFVR